MDAIDQLKTRLYDAIHRLENAIVKKVVEASSEDTFLIKQQHNDVKEENNTLRNNLFQLENTLNILKNQNQNIKKDVDSLIDKIEQIIEE